VRCSECVNPSSNQPINQLIGQCQCTHYTVPAPVAFAYRWRAAHKVTNTLSLNHHHHHHTYPTLTKLQYPSISNPNRTQIIPPFHAILLLYSLFTSFFVTFVVLGKIFWSMGVESPAACKISQYGKIHNLYCSPNIVRVIKSSKMRWAGHTARMG
jgi:hypothetical protein